MPCIPVVLLVVLKVTPADWSLPSDVFCDLDLIPVLIKKLRTVYLSPLAALIVELYGI